MENGSFCITLCVRKYRTDWTVLRIHPTCAVRVLLYVANLRRLVAVLRTSETLALSALFLALTLLWSYGARRLVRE